MADELLADIIPDAPAGGDDGAIPPDPSKAAIAEPSWNAKEWAYPYKGQTFYPESREKALQLMEKGHAFAQRLGEVNKDWESKFESLKPYQELDKFFGSNKDFARKVSELYQQYQSGGQPDDPIQSKISEIESFIETARQREADRDLEQAKAKLQAQYKDYDWQGVDGEGQTLMQRVMKHALETGVLDINVAFRDLMWEQQNAKTDAAGRAAAAEAVQKAAKAGIITGASPSGGAPIQKFDPSKHTWQDTLRLALEETGRT